MATMSINMFGQINPTTLKAAIDTQITNKAAGTVTRASIGGRMKEAVDYATEQSALKANTADLGSAAFSNDYNDLDNLPSTSSSLPYKTFIFHLSQTGTSAPIIGANENELDGTFAMVRYSTGVYGLTSSSNVFTVGKVYGFGTRGSGAGWIAISSVINSRVDIQTFNSAGSLSDGVLDFSIIEIRVYN